MGHFRRQVLLNSMKLFDLAAVMLAFGLATVVVSQKATVSLAEFFAMRVKIQNFIVFAILLLIWHQIFVLFGMYASRRLAGRWEETVDILKATTLGTLLIFFAHILVHIVLVTPEFLLVFWLAAAGTAATGRLLMRIVLRNARLRGRNLRDMLIVGTNPRAVQFAHKMRDNQFLGYRVIGFVDQEWPGITEFSQSGFSLACNFDQLLTYLRSTVVMRLWWLYRCVRCTPVPRRWPPSAKSRASLFVSFPTCSMGKCLAPAWWSWKVTLSLPITP